MARYEDLADLPTRTTEDVRAYGRELDKIALDLITELECRAHELRGALIAMLKYCKANSIGEGKSIGWKASRSVATIYTATVALRAVRVSAKRIYPRIEKFCGVELEELRRRKGKTKSPDHDPLDV
ncbi:hypothetical protein GCM10022224_080310 [Nonomuraea antimicrobica]|uniref:Uncharacterized protein n=1 Tax=Nonomuraea antimicrobica TaxID=561173 RepID=A0ABP7DCI5_9ACTN